MEKRVKEPLTGCFSISGTLKQTSRFMRNMPLSAGRNPKEKYAADHKEELDAYNAALRYFKVHLDGAKYSTKKLAEGTGSSFPENIASKTEALTAGTGGCKDFAGCAPLAQSGFAIRAVPPDRRAGKETVHPAGGQRPGAAYPGGTGRETPDSPAASKNRIWNFNQSGACHFPRENDRRFSYFQEDLPIERI